MREIKFRAYHPDEMKMYYFDSFESIGNWVNGDGSYREPNFPDASVKWMQYTGLKAKGVEIYEGDIVSQEPTTRPMVVHWVEDRAYFQPFQLDRDIKEWEVIGNIYEDYKPLEEEI